MQTHTRGTYLFQKINCENSFGTYKFVACFSFSVVVVTDDTSHNSQTHTKDAIDRNIVKDRG